MSNFNLSNQSYSIDEELVMKREIQKRISPKIEVNRNPDKYDFDLELYRWETNSSVVREKVGYIELEKYSDGDWSEDSLPDGWFEISFLRRKLFKFNRQTGFWSDEEKENIESTVYMKFNDDLTSSFVCPSKFVAEEGNESSRGSGGYNDSYWKLPKRKVLFGIDSCCEYIEEFSKNGYRKDKWMDFVDYKNPWEVTSP